MSTLSSGDSSKPLDPRDDLPSVSQTMTVDSTAGGDLGVAQKSIKMASHQKECNVMLTSQMTP